MRKPMLACCLLVLAGGAFSQEQLITLKNDTIHAFVIKRGGTPLYTACRAIAAGGVIASGDNGYGRSMQVPAPTLRSGSGLIAGSGALLLKRAAICWHPVSKGLE